MEKPNHTIDSLGDICPLPLVKAKKLYESMCSGDSLKIITDHSCVVSSLNEYFIHFPCTIFIEEVLNGVWEIYIKKV